MANDSDNQINQQLVDHFIYRSSLGTDLGKVAESVGKTCGLVYRKMENRNDQCDKLMFESVLQIINEKALAHGSVSEVRADRQADLADYLQAIHHAKDVIDQISSSGLHATEALPKVIELQSFLMGVALELSKFRRSSISQ